MLGTKKSLWGLEMKLLSTVLGLTLTSVVALATANAADVYPVGGYKDGPVFATVNWAGWYVGANAGYAWSGQDIDADTNFMKLSPEGGFGGGQIGYNWQGVWHPHLVLGVEADLQGAGISDSKSASGKFSNVNGTWAESAKTEINWFGTVRGRLGYAFGPTLVYGTAGLAYGEVGDNFAFHDYYSGSSSSASRTQTQTGYVVGAGVEHKFTPAWSVKAEYQYINLGNDDFYHKNNTVYGSAVSKDVDLSTVRAGINYHVGAGFEPLK
jgi:outer membrane immunogenic protein